MTQRTAALEMQPEEFRRLGRQMVDEITELLAKLRDRPATPGGEPRPGSGRSGE